MIKRNSFIKLLFFIVLASLLNSCANLNKLPKHNTPLIKNDIRTLGKKRMEETLEIGPVPVFGDTTKLKKRKNISSETVKNYLIIPNEYKKLKQNISFKFYNTPIKDVMILMSRLGGINILVGDEVSGTITANLSNIPWDRSFQAILDMKGYASDIDVENNLIRIQLPGTLTSQDSYYSQRALAIKQKVEVENSIDPILSEIFRLYYLSPADAKKTLLSVFREKSGSSSTIQITEENTTRSIIIRGTNKDLNIVEKIIKEIDKRTQQVLIEAFIVEANSDFEKALGTRLGAYKNIGSTVQGGIIGTSTGSGTTAVLGDAAILGGNTDSLTNFPVAGATSGIGIIRKFGTSMLKLEITALETLGLGKTISNPKVFTLNNQLATITQGEQIPYQVIADGTTTTSFKDAALILSVTPNIIGDGNVLLTIQVNNDTPNRSSVGEPSINKMEIKTKLLVADGDIVVIGGIKKNVRSNATSKTPFFRRSTSSR
jgi:type IV pilus assembly protein PilQ